MSFLKVRFSIFLDDVINFFLLLFYLFALLSILLEYRHLIIIYIFLILYPRTIDLFPHQDLFFLQIVHKRLLLPQTIFFHFLHFRYKRGFLIRISYSYHRFLLFFSKLHDPCLNRALLMIIKFQLVFSLHHITIGMLTHAGHHHISVHSEILRISVEEILFASNHRIGILPPIHKAIIITAQSVRFIHFAVSSVFGVHFF